MATLTWSQQEELIALIRTVHADPWSCQDCGDQITNDTGAHPEVLLLEHPSRKGIGAFAVVLFCGPCWLIRMSK